MPASRQELLNPEETTALCCINVASLLKPQMLQPQIRWAQPLRTVWKHSTVCVGVRSHACVVQVGLGLLLAPLCLSPSLA